MNHSDDNDDGVKGSSFSFVRSDSMPSKDEESSGDENHTQFAFIKEEDDVNDDVSLQSQDHESVKPVAENVSPIISTCVCGCVVCVCMCACMRACVCVYHTKHTFSAGRYQKLLNSIYIV